MRGLPARLGAGVAVCLAAVTALTVAGSTRLAPQLGVPRNGALLGAYVNPDALVPGTNVEVQYQWRSTLELERRLGRPFDVLQFYWGWQDGFPDDGFEGWAIEHGAIPMINWDGTALKEIVDGRHDDWIAARARAVQELNVPVFLRFAWEMNGDWYDWSGARNGASHAAASDYVQAWRRVHDIFTREGADNAIWVWAPNYVSIPNTRDDGPEAAWNDFRNYYPGDRYVDWVGIDAYNAGSWASWDELLAPDDLPRIYHHFAGRKPIMISETASQEAAEANDAPTGVSKAAWIADVRRRLPAGYPEIRAFLWFHLRGEDRDFRVDSSGDALAAFRELAHDPYFGASGRG